MKPSLSTSIGSLTLERPTILASGILGISLDVFQRLHKAGAGGVVTKSLSKEPWEGYPNPTIFSVKGGGWINAVGLSNPGAENFAEMIRPNENVPIIVSLVGSVEEDFEFMIKKFQDCKVTAYELNLSCPHVAKVGLEVGDDTELVSKIGMQICQGPITTYLDMPGNRGLTGLVIIETSHIALHCWDETDPGLLQLDVYTCGELPTDVIFEEIKQFDPVKVEYKFLNRERGLTEIEI